MYRTRIKGTPLKRSVYATATSLKGKKAGPGIPLTTAMTRARIRINTSDTMKICTLSKNAPRTEGRPSEPTSDCQRCGGLKNRSATTPLPGASTTTTAMVAKNSTVLALDTSTPRFPRGREPRPADGPIESPKERCNRPLTGGQGSSSAYTGILVASGLFGEHSRELGRRRRVRDERVRAAAW